MFAWFRNLGVRWKLLLAPAFLIVVLVAFGGYAVYMLRVNQTATEALISGPVRQAELVSDFNTTVWMAQARLYNLTATAANESDVDKIKKNAAAVASALAVIPKKLKELESTKNAENAISQILQRLAPAVTNYLKQAGTVIEFADTDAGSALMFAVNAERSFAQIEKLTDDLTQASNDLRDREIARSNRWLEQQAILLPAVVLAAVMFGSLVSLLVSGGIAKPVVGLAGAMKRLGDGDFSVVLPGLGRKDEVGQMAAAVEAFKSKSEEKAKRDAEEAIDADRRAAARRKAEMQELADTFEQTVGSIVKTVASESTELEATAGTLNRTAETTQQLAGTVASASDEASTNVQAVASATNEMSSSVAEISRQVQNSSRIANEAVKQASKTDQRISELSEAAGRIGDVVKLITAIAEQTNLLALNATIEAARAGEAGKGFAVVAQEVKALAAQTAKATDEISSQISGMQAATQDSVVAIKEIGGTIGSIAEIAAAIAAAVEEQGAATQEIARNIQQASQSTCAVASNIGEVNKGAAETGNACAQMLASARSLSGESDRLRYEVEKFLGMVRAG
jgi:methyl-accepting chemotaxis protein